LQKRLADGVISTSIAGMITPHSIVVTDTSLLINFLAIDRIDLLYGCGHNILITDHVVAEITGHYPDQLSRLRAALDAGMLQQIAVTQTEEIDLFRQLTSSGRLGVGECSAIAVAIHRSYVLGIDDRRAKKHAVSLHKHLRIVGTQELVLMVIRSGLLDVAVADAIKDEWAKNHSFTLKIGSFGDLLK
jgi:predicted nucleic acid-binding protein